MVRRVCSVVCMCEVLEFAIRVLLYFELVFGSRCGGFFAGGF